MLGVSQVGMGEWRMHISPNRGQGVVEANGAVYAALENGLVEYDVSAGETSVRTVANFLSDVTLSAIGYDPKNNVAVIGYANGNLDLLIEETIFNIPAINQSSISGLKTINNMKPHDGEMYLATGFGIVVVNIEKREIKDTYFPTPENKRIIDLVVLNDSLYALTENEMYVGALSNNFLSDHNQWQKASYTPDYINSGKYKTIEKYNGELFIGFDHEDYGKDTVFRRENYNLSVFLDDTELNKIKNENGNLMLCMEGRVSVYNSSLIDPTIIYLYGHGAFPSPTDVIYYDDHYFISDRTSGLVKVKGLDLFSTQHITFDGPANPKAFRATWTNGKLAVAGGGVAGNNATFSQAGGFTLENEKWLSFNTNTQELIAAGDIRDFISVAINPRNTEEVAFGAYSRTPVLLIEDGVTVTDTFGYTNSFLEETSFGNGMGFVTDMSYDNSGNLWVLNSHSLKPLKVRDEKGMWNEFDISNSLSNKRTRRLKIDNNGVKWFAVNGVGIIAFDDNGTLEDASDDRYRILNTSPNSGDLPTSSVAALAVDHNNNVWIGTEEGMRVLYNTFNVFDADAGDYNFQQLLIEFGENVEVVLGTTHITSIEVDGANRKWIGTANAGVFLFSADGLTLIENFTQDNSPLLSNNILDIAIDHNNGEVFFVTGEGMISYRSDASRGDRNYTNVKVFPNPVYPDYFGPITIQGISDNSAVKITDVSGKLVYQTMSNGGTATWNGKTLNGNRVTTGVYLIWTTVDVQDQNVKGRKVGKVVFIN